MKIERLWQGNAVTIVGTVELDTLEARVEALEKQIGLHPMPDYGDLMTLEEFLVAVKAGGIGDDDGSAYLASTLGCTGIQVRPSDVLGGITLGTKFSHIAWFNK
jgi:hypothetical protein